MAHECNPPVKEIVHSKARFYRSKTVSHPVSMTSIFFDVSYLRLGC